MADVNPDNLDSKYGDDMTASVERYAANHKVKPSGVIEIPKAVYMEGLASHGVTEAEIKRVHHAIDFENTAAGHLALRDVERKIGEADQNSLADESFRTGLSSTVRLPTIGGATEVTVNAEKWNRIPFQTGDDGEPMRRPTHGRVDISITTKGRIHKTLTTECNNRIRAALGVTVDADGKALEAVD